MNTPATPAADDRAAMEEGEMLPCPFCGAPPRTHKWMTESLFSHAQVEWLQIQCDDCDIMMSSEQQDDLRDRWNRRAGSPLGAGGVVVQQTWGVIDKDGRTVGPLSDTQEQAERMERFLNRDRPGLRDTTYRAVPLHVTTLTASPTP
jgi:Lar family restriction alleviation protein